MKTATGHRSFHLFLAMVAGVVALGLAGWPDVGSAQPQRPPETAVPGVMPRLDPGPRGASRVTVKQVSSGRFLIPERRRDWSAVVTSAKPQVWAMQRVAAGTYTFTQHWPSTGHGSAFVELVAKDDFNVAVRQKRSANDRQFWMVVAKGNGIYTIAQVNDGRFLDAHEYAGMNFGVVTRPNQNNATQLWQISPQP